MKRMVIVTTMVFFVFGLLASCATTATSKQKLVQGPDFIFRTKPDSHKKKGYAYSASISCIQGKWQKLVQGYNNNPYTENSEIMSYLNSLNSELLDSKCQSEYEVLSGTYKGFKPEDLTNSLPVVKTEMSPQPQQKTFDTDWYQKRKSAVQTQRHEQKNIVYVQANQRRVSMLRDIIPSHWQETAEVVTTIDSSLGNKTVVRGNGGTETIIFTEKTVARLEKMATNPASGDSLLAICPTQAKQLGRALGRPTLATYTASCPGGNCEHAKIKHLKACTKPLDWHTTTNGTPVAYVVCELKGGKREGQISAAWRFDPYKSGAGADGWYLGFVKYSQWEPAAADWGQIPQAAWAHIEKISQKRPAVASPPQLYDVCDFKLF